MATTQRMSPTDGIERAPYSHRDRTVMCLGPATQDPNLQKRGMTHVTFKREGSSERKNAIDLGKPPEPVE